MIPNLREFFKGKKNPILGLSGGPDSLLLFTLLLEAKVLFEVAHIDHSWRGKSAEEAHWLQKVVEEKGILFHIKTLAAPKQQKNLEELGRKERFSFFQQLCQERGFGGVVLGHHADDQAETVLKRLLEGASFPKLNGMQREGDFKGMALWRPLLGMTKEEITHECAKRGLTPIEDETNGSDSFLRGRMRNRLIPQLEETFGKGVRKNLCLLADEAELFRGGIERMVAPHLGSKCDCRDLDPLLLPYLIRKMAGSSISREQVADAVRLLRECASHKQVGPLGIDRGWLYRNQKG